MKSAKLSSPDFPKKFMLLICFLLLVTGCNQLGVDPEARFALILVVAIVSFIVMFTRPILGVYAVSVVSISFSPSVRAGFANLYFHQWLILIALLASISSGLILRNFHTKIKSEINAPMMVFIGSLLLSLAHAPNMVIGIKSFLHIGVLISSFYLFLLCVNREEHIKFFIVLLIIATSIICLVSFKYHSSGRLGSLVLINPNSFGNFLALVIPFCISLLFYAPFEKKKKLVLAFFLVVMLANLVLTSSRSAWVGVFVGMLSLCILKPKTSIVLILCGIITAVFLYAPVHKRMVRDISDPGAQYRIIKAKIAYNTFKKHPILGDGLGSFQHGAQFSDIWAYYAHSSLENNYLLMLAEGGIVEFAAFLFFAFCFMKITFTVMNKLDNPFIYSVVLGSFSSFISALGAGMFEGTLFNPQFNWLIGMFMACPVIARKLFEKECDHQKDSIPIESVND